MWPMLHQVIRQLREARGMSQAQLALKAKITPAYVALIELGQRTNPSLDVVRRLARALRVPLKDLLG
jgi:transcriptional regulator with XRE-family HTH domain